MPARLLMIAVAVLTVSTGVAAEPAKTPAKDAAPPVSHSAPVILASADPVRTPAPTDQATLPQAKPHRAARVTTCRCGDQLEEQPEQ